MSADLLRSRPRFAAPYKPQNWPENESNPRLSPFLYHPDLFTTDTLLWDHTIAALSREQRRIDKGHKQMYYRSDIPSPLESHNESWADAQKGQKKSGWGLTSADQKDEKGLCARIARHTQDLHLGYRNRGSCNKVFHRQSQEALPGDLDDRASAPGATALCGQKRQLYGPLAFRRSSGETSQIVAALLRTRDGRSPDLCQPLFPEHPLLPGKRLSPGTSGRRCGHHREPGVQLVRQDPPWEGRPGGACVPNRAWRVAYRTALESVHAT